MSELLRAINSTSNESLPAKKCDVTTARTVEKWIAENNKVFNTAKWLSCNKVNQEYVATLKCCMCKSLNDKLHSSRNFNPAFIVGWMNL